MYKICYYVPKEHNEEVKNAIFKTGAGKIDNYDMCCFQTIGEGQFRPLEGSHAYLGEVGKVEKVEEIKVEFVCRESLVKQVIAALKLAHPYETPAYQVMKIENF